jgi:hypothetical protein
MKALPALVLLLLHTGVAAAAGKPQAGAYCAACVDVSLLLQQALRR